MTPTPDQPNHIVTMNVDVPVVYRVEGDRVVGPFGHSVPTGLSLVDLARNLNFAHHCGYQSGCDDEAEART